ncbi:MAG: proton-conducting membrane transporter [Lachnospiraceae bacterium]|nr:proton-conducting membrane transporter [Lachnospiraceae bacterium]
MSFLLPLTVFFPLVCAFAFLFVRKKISTHFGVCLYTGVVMCVSAVLNVVVAIASASEELRFVLIKITDTVSLTFKADNLSLVFALLMSFMFVTVGFYSFDYMRHEENTKRFYLFYMCLIGILPGMYYSADLISLYLFYEMMTLFSLPLVLHSLTKEAISAGFKYLFYSIGGALLSLMAIFVIYSMSSEHEFTEGGFLDPALVSGKEGLLLAFVFLAIIGFGCKAGLFPMHDWLPVAHPIAPAPASALLSGIITKSGVLAIIRVVFYSVGADRIMGTWVQYTWMILALVTVFMGSMLAYCEKGLKKRLAFSTVSQVSYVLFGLSLMNPVAILGALLHVIFHSVIKDDLFLVSGVIIHNTGATRCDELDGVGRKMPASIIGFTIASVALIGIPPASGFISKWFLAEGALTSGTGAFSVIGPVVLLVSALLTAGYLLPVMIDGFFKGKSETVEKPFSHEAKPLSLVPIVVLSALALLLGIFPGILTGFLEGIAGSMIP